MVIWSGLGYLVLVILLADSLLIQLISGALTNNSRYFQENSMLLVLSLWLSSAIIYFLGRWLNSRKAKIYIDKETGQEIKIQNNHRLFFIPMQYWGLLTFIGGLVIFIKSFV